MTDNFSSLVGGIASIYGTDTIFILGKGPSADEVPPEVFSGSLVIGINDAERIYPADISIFHADWVIRSLQESGPKAQLYLTSSGYCPSPGHKVLQAPYISLTQEGADLMVQRLLADDFVVEDVLFMSALRVAREVAELRGRPQQVYMVGFDFRPELGYAHVDGKQFGAGMKTNAPCASACKKTISSTHSTCCRVAGSTCIMLAVGPIPA